MEKDKNTDANIGLYDSRDAENVDRIHFTV